MEFVSEAAVAKIIAQLDFAAITKAAYIAAAAGNDPVAPVLRAVTGEPGQGMNLKFGASGALVGGKLGTYWSGNAAKGLQNHGATTVLLDAETGFPRAILAARLLNRFRTAAGDAVAVDTLARPDASVLALIGAGVQAPFEARAIAAVRTLTDIRVASRSAAHAASVAEELQDLAPHVRACGVAEAVDGADIVVTITSARAPLIMADWISPGTHISAMGADAVGKQEIDPELLANSQLYADLPEQARIIGESQHGGRLPIAIGDVLAGRCQGRAHDSDITIFDGTGIVAQDLHVAEAALAAARGAGLTQTIEW